MLTTHDLFKLRHPEPADHSKPYFNFAVRTDGPWVTLVAQNNFADFVPHYARLKEYFKNKEVHILVERLEQDKDDSVRYNTTVLEES